MHYITRPTIPTKSTATTERNNRTYKHENIVKPLVARVKVKTLRNDSNATQKSIYSEFNRTAFIVTTTTTISPRTQKTMTTGVKNTITTTVPTITKETAHRGEKAVNPLGNASTRAVTTVSNKTQNYSPRTHKTMTTRVKSTITTTAPTMAKGTARAVTTASNKNQNYIPAAPTRALNNPSKFNTTSNSTDYVNPSEQVFKNNTTTTVSPITMPEITTSPRANITITTAAPSTIKGTVNKGEEIINPIGNAGIETYDF